MTKAPRPTLRSRAAAPFRAFWNKLTPAPRVRRAAALGGILGAVALLAWMATETDSGAPFYVEAGVGAGLALVAILLAPLAVWLVRVVWGAGRGLLGIGVLAAWLGTALLLAATAGPSDALLQAGVAVLLPAAVFGGLRACLAGERRWSRIAGAAWAAFGLATAGFGAWWLLDQRGTTDHLVDLAPRDPATLPATLAAQDPGAPGGWPVARSTYGSGLDRHRPEFGDGVDIRTEPVDGRPFARWPKGSGFSGWFGAKGNLRREFWGFGLEALPRNGRVWHPTGGEGPFPLVLIVHGNHSMGDFSDDGYGWLGEHLASHGFIAVSVDENFCNSSFTGGSLGEENDLRAWLLLRHLELWRAWNEDPAHPLRGMVDMERIALVGHSRGGEAVAVAAVFNRLDRYPDDGNIAFDFGFSIRAIAAIAPVDGQYRPADQRAVPTDVDVFTIHGAHDGDVTSFHGDRIYARTRFTDAARERDHFKATAYVYRANHGQFNTSWGDSDRSGVRRFLLNRAALMSGADQRQVGRVFLGAFLAASLQGQREYRRLLRDAAVGRDWLPQNPTPIIVTKFESASVTVVADFEEDVDLATTTADDARIATSGLTIWREGDIELRDGRRENQGVWLGWSDRADDQPAERPVPEQPAWFEVRWPEGSDLAARAAQSDRLRFDVAEADEKPAAKRYADADEGQGEEDGGDGEQGGNDESQPTAGAGEDEDDAEADEPREPIDFGIVLENAAGAVLRLDASAFGVVPPPLQTQVTRTPLDGARSTELNLQTFSIPLLDLRLQGFDTDRLVAVRFVFDRAPRGVVVVDRIGFDR